MHGAELLLELGGVILGLGVLGRIAGRVGLSPIPLYLLAGLAFGKGGLLPGWPPLAAVVLGGVTYVSSSGIAAKLLDDLGRLGNRGTPTVLSVLVMEDLAMAAYLPILTGLLTAGRCWPRGSRS